MSDSIEPKPKVGELEAAIALAESWMKRPLARHDERKALRTIIDALAFYRLHQPADTSYTGRIIVDVQGVAHPYTPETKDSVVRSEHVEAGAAQEAGLAERILAMVEEGAAMAEACVTNSTPEGYAEAFAKAECAAMREALERLAGQSNEQVEWTDAGVRCRAIARSALASPPKEKD